MDSKPRRQASNQNVMVDGSDISSDPWARHEVGDREPYLLGLAFYRIALRPLVGPMLIPDLTLGYWNFLEFLANFKKVIYPVLLSWN